MMSRVEEVLARHAPPAAVALVARDDTVEVACFGDASRESIFRIASQSKAIVSVAALTLVEEGKLLLTDPIGKYLPEFLETKVAVARDGGGYDKARSI